MLSFMGTRTMEEAPALQKPTKEEQKSTIHSQKHLNINHVLRTVLCDFK